MNERSVFPSLFYSAAENAQSGKSHVKKFTQADIAKSAIHYVHSSNSKGRDSFEFNVTSPKGSKGPYSLYIDIHDEAVVITSTTLYVMTGKPTVLTRSVLNITVPEGEAFNVDILSPPAFGFLTTLPLSLSNISSLSSFSSQMLTDGRVVYLSDLSMSPQSPSDSFIIRVCFQTTICSSPHTINVQVPPFQFLLRQVLHQYHKHQFRSPTATKNHRN